MVPFFGPSPQTNPAKADGAFGRPPRNSGFSHLKVKSDDIVSPPVVLQILLVLPPAFWKLDIRLLGPIWSQVLKRSQERSRKRDKSQTTMATASWRDLPRREQLIVITLARLSEPLVQTSIQSYMFYQLKWFDPSLPDSIISSQAGILQCVVPFGCDRVLDDSN